MTTVEEINQMKTGLMSIFHMTIYNSSIENIFKIILAEDKTTLESLLNMHGLRSLVPVKLMKQKV